MKFQNTSNLKKNLLFTDSNCKTAQTTKLQTTKAIFPFRQLIRINQTDSRSRLEIGLIIIRE